MQYASEGQQKQDHCYVWGYAATGALGKYVLMVMPE